MTTAPSVRGSSATGPTQANRPFRTTTLCPAVTLAAAASTTWTLRRKMNSFGASACSD
jgi:hypothetical protein